jgi:hypothetical protein
MVLRIFFYNFVRLYLLENILTFAGLVPRSVCVTVYGFNPPAWLDFSILLPSNPARARDRASTKRSHRQGMATTSQHRLA